MEEEWRHISLCSFSLRFTVLLLYSPQNTIHAAMVDNLMTCCGRRRRRRNQCDAIRCERRERNTQRSDRMRWDGMEYVCLLLYLYSTLFLKMHQSWKEAPERARAYNGVAFIVRRTASHQDEEEEVDDDDDGDRFLFFFLPTHTHTRSFLCYIKRWPIQQVFTDESWVCVCRNDNETM